MKKLRTEVLEHMMKSKLSRKEVFFILYVGRFQNEYGIATEINYKDICTEIDVSIQGVCNCMQTLEKKGIIKCEEHGHHDIDIEILDNSSAGKERTEVLLFGWCSP